MGKQVVFCFLFLFLIMKWRFWYLYQIAFLDRDSKQGVSLAGGKWENPWRTDYSES